MASYYVQQNLARFPLLILWLGVQFAALFGLGILLAFFPQGCSGQTPRQPVIVQPTTWPSNDWQLPATLPLTGRGFKALDAFDGKILELMRKHNIPGASIAIAKNGRLVYARGFGYADIQKQKPVNPNSLFRIASISKVLTAAAIMKLVQEGKLKLNHRAFRILKNSKPCRPGPIDKRLYEITIAQLLNMTAGWDRDISGDPGFKDFSYAAAQTCGGKVPADPLTVIRFCMGRPLDFTPGTRYAYSNLAYTTLGQIVEQVSGMPYLQYVNNEVLKPIGASSTMPGGTLLTLRKPNEVIYYDKPGAKLATPIYPDLKELVPNCYGGNFSLEAMLASGGFISTASDLVRIGSSISGEREGPIDLGTYRLMASRAPLAQGKDQEKDHYYGLGYDIYLVRNGQAFNWSKDGSLCGTRALLAHRCDHVTWAFICNTKNKENDFMKEVAETIWSGINSVRDFSDYDLFERYR